MLDTNVIAELMKPHPDEKVLSLIDRQSDPLITSVTAPELLDRANRLPDGQRRARIVRAIADLLDLEFASRVLPFDLMASVE